MMAAHDQKSECKQEPYVHIVRFLLFRIFYNLLKVLRLNSLRSFFRE